VKGNELPRLFFGESGSTNDGRASLSDTRTTFYGLKGLVAPPEDQDRLEWTDEQLLYRPILNLASWACLREVYRRPRDERKGLALDEVHEITTSGVGRTLVQKSASDSRKHNLAALVLTQNPSGIQGISASSKGSISNLIGSAFLGRTEEEDEQRGNCALLRLPDDPEYSAMFGQLSIPTGRSRRETEQKDMTPREFIAKDYHGNVEKIVADQNHHADFMRAADSTPTAGKEERLSRNGLAAEADEVSL
ncbi:MAG: ATP-binding protein, partial [Kocuria sp.]|nr:ATP-binding protein [Kocuria sp.]